jgi:hypothetical protein
MISSCFDERMPEPTIDECAAELRRLGWSVGDTLIRTDDGLRWVVYCHRGEDRVVTKAQSQSEAWREARRLVAAL